MTDWIPFELVNIGNRRLVRWIELHEPFFLEPFFDQTIRALINTNAAQKLTSIEDIADIQPTKKPKGFIFHVSRCGSTLSSRSLAAVSRHRVISEAAPLNQLLLEENLDESVRQILLKGLIHTLCGTASDTDCFIKFTSWNLLFLEQILVLFPNTPWVFIYRDPTEVLRSLIGNPPRWAANQKLAKITGNPHSKGVEQMIFSLECLFKAPLPHVSQLGQFINYCQLPEAILEASAHFGLELDQVERSRIIRMGQYDAKQPGEVKFLAREREPLSVERGKEILPLCLLYQEWERMRLIFDKQFTKRIIF